MIDPYVTLGIRKDANIEEIRRAHRKLILTCHPDKVRDLSKVDEAQKQFARVQEAYELLSDSERRRKYDIRCESFTSDSRFSDDRSPGDSYDFAGSRSYGEYRDGHPLEERVPRDEWYDRSRYSSSSFEPSVRGSASRSQRYGYESEDYPHMGGSNVRSESRFYYERPIIVERRPSSVGSYDEFEDGSMPTGYGRQPRRSGGRPPLRRRRYVVIS